MRFERVDKNQPEIVKALRRCGATVKHVYTVKNLFDILVYYEGITYNVEIKQDRKKKLTPGEQKCKEDIETAGVKYWVVYSVEDALNMIGIK
jgi:Holliday junction resolvase